MSKKNNNILETKLWYFVTTSDYKYEFRLTTLSELEKAVTEDFTVLNYRIVHPDSPVFPKEFCKYNEKYKDLIAETYYSQTKLAIEMFDPYVFSLEGVHNFDNVTRIFDIYPTTWKKTKKTKTEDLDDCFNIFPEDEDLFSDEETGEVKNVK